MDLNSRFLRSYAVVSDKYGIDPLQDRVVPKLKNITAFTVHIVTHDEIGAPDLIAFREYQDEALWWIILAYNGIGSWKDLIEGTNLRIPNQSSVVSAFTENAIKPNRIQRVVTI